MGSVPNFPVANWCRKKTRNTVFRYTVFRYMGIWYPGIRWGWKLSGMPCSFFCCQPVQEENPVHSVPVHSVPVHSVPVHSVPVHGKIRDTSHIFICRPLRDFTWCPLWNKRGRLTLVPGLTLPKIRKNQGHFPYFSLSISHD